jgi:hypothetical protein
LTVIIRVLGEEMRDERVVQRVLKVEGKIMMVPFWE